MYELTQKELNVLNEIKKSVAAGENMISFNKLGLKAGIVSGAMSYIKNQLERKGHVKFGKSSYYGTPVELVTPAPTDREPEKSPIGSNYPKRRSSIELTPREMTLLKALEKELPEGRGMVKLKLLGDTIGFTDGSVGYVKDGLVNKGYIQILGKSHLGTEIELLAPMQTDTAPTGALANTILPPRMNIKLPETFLNDYYSALCTYLPTGEGYVTIYDFVGAVNLQTGLELQAHNLRAANKKLVQLKYIQMQQSGAKGTFIRLLKVTYDENGKLLPVPVTDRPITVKETVTKSQIKEELVSNDVVIREEGKKKRYLKLEIPGLNIKVLFPFSTLALLMSGKLNDPTLTYLKAIKEVLDK